MKNAPPPVFIGDIYGKEQVHASEMNNVESVMQCLKEHCDCTVRELYYNLSYSEHTVCGILHGRSQPMCKYVKLSNCILEGINWTADFSGVSKILAHTFEHGLQLKLTTYDTRTCEVKEEIVILHPGIKEIK